MSSSFEFKTVLGLMIYLDIHSSSNSRNINETKLEENNDINEDKKTNSSGDRGKMFTIAGPPQGSGESILEDPEMLWLEDIPWSEEKTQEAQERIKSQGSNASLYWKNKYITKAAGYWHEFYNRNTDNFYKDRHYLHIIFPELLNKPSGCNECDGSSCDQQIHLLEVGCGVGNAVIPLLEINPHLLINAIDFAKSAISILINHPKVLSSNGRIIANVCDIINDPLPVSDGSQDLVLCMFVLSAIGPEVGHEII